MAYISHNECIRKKRLEIEVTEEFFKMFKSSE